MKIIGIGQSKLWDDIVRSFSGHDVYYLSGYVKAFRRHGDGEPVLLYYENDRARGMCVLMIRDVANDQLFAGKIAKGEFFDASSPYGYGGFIFEGDVDTGVLKSELDETLALLNVNSVFYRFHPVLNNADDNLRITEVVPLGKTIALDLTSPEKIWNNMTRTCRNRIRKAAKSGVTVNHSDNPELLLDFKIIYDKTMAVLNADNYYFFEREFYDSIASDLKGNYQTFYASFEGKIISMAIMIYANDQLHYHLSGSLREYLSLAPCNLLLYQAALWGHGQGFKTLHLGGGYGMREDSLYTFKQKFNRNSYCRFAVGKSIIDTDTYNKLLSVRNISEDDARLISFFPQYRAKI